MKYSSLGSSILFFFLACSLNSLCLAMDPITLYIIVSSFWVKIQTCLRITPIHWLSAWSFQLQINKLLIYSLKESKEIHIHNKPIISNNGSHYMGLSYRNDWPQFKEMSNLTSALLHATEFHGVSSKSLKVSFLIVIFSRERQN